MRGETRMRLRLLWVHTWPPCGVGTSCSFQSLATDRSDSPASTRSAASLIRWDDRLVGTVPVDDHPVLVVDGALVPVGATAAVGPPILGELQMATAGPPRRRIRLVPGHRALDPQR